MTAAELRRLFIDFFSTNGHREIMGASLIPANDPTVLFTTAGMHPLVPYLLGERHPAGRRLVNCQKCLRTDDIDEVGDDTHLTFFEMLGSWSLGDYAKDEAIRLSYTFLTECIGLEPGRLWVSVFGGGPGQPADEEAGKIWKSMGIPSARIRYLGMKENWWGPVGRTGPCGPCTEMFYDLQPGGDPDPTNYEGGRFVEIWNDVFMQFNRTASGGFEPLAQKNVDTGLGFERVAALLQDKESVFETELLAGIVDRVRSLARYSAERSLRIVADHIRAATFVMAEGVAPSNKDQGYVVRRLLRRAVRHGRMLGIEKAFTADVAKEVVGASAGSHPELTAASDSIYQEMQREERRFQQTIDRGERQFHRVLRQLAAEGADVLDGRAAFDLYETYGFPLELTRELAGENGLRVDVAGFQAALRDHQQQSRQGSRKRFAGGLADHSERARLLHTATHLLHQALRLVLGDHVAQRGSNVTPERLRFDFSHPARLSDDELRRVEAIVNEQILLALPVTEDVMTVDKAKRAGAIGLFESRYGQQVKVYSIGGFSKEICAGPHAGNTAELESFRIIKQESVSAGVRRIKAVAGE